MEFIGFRSSYKRYVGYSLVILFVFSFFFCLSLIYFDSIGLRYFWIISTFLVFFVFPSFVISFVVGNRFNGLNSLSLLVVSFFSFLYDYDGFKNSLLVGYAVGLAYQSPLLVYIVFDLFGRTKNNRALMKGYRKILGAYFFLLFFFGVLILIEFNQ